MESEGGYNTKRERTKSGLGWTEEKEEGRKDCLRPSFLSYPPPRRLLLFEPPVYLQVSSVFINWTTWSKYTSEEFCMSHLLHRFSSSIRGVSECIKTSGILWPSAGSNHNTSIFSPQNIKLAYVVTCYFFFIWNIWRLELPDINGRLKLREGPLSVFLWSDGGTAEEKNCTNHREKIQQVGKLLPTEKDSCTTRK